MASQVMAQTWMHCNSLLPGRYFKFGNSEVVMSIVLVCYMSSRVRGLGLISAWAYSGPNFARCTSMMHGCSRQFIEAQNEILQNYEVPIGSYLCEAARVLLDQCWVCCFRSADLLSVVATGSVRFGTDVHLDSGPSNYPSFEFYVVGGCWQFSDLISSGACMCRLVCGQTSG